MYMFETFICSLGHDNRGKDTQLCLGGEHAEGTAETTFKVTVMEAAAHLAEYWWRRFSVGDGSCDTVEGLALVMLVVVSSKFHAVDILSIQVIVQPIYSPWMVTYFDMENKTSQ